MNKVLIGNTFPMTLIRRKATIQPVSMDTFIKTAQSSAVYSFWGHENTLEAIKETTGLDLKVKGERPVISLSENKLPVLYGQEFNTVWIVNPDYKGNFRPKIGEEVGLEKIKGWSVLLLKFK